MMACIPWTAGVKSCVPTAQAKLSAALAAFDADGEAQAKADYMAVRVVTTVIEPNIRGVASRTSMVDCRRMGARL